MEVKEAFVTRKNPAEIFFVIEDTLLQNINTQVFIDKAILKKLYKYGANYHVFYHNYQKSFHYAHGEDGFGGETWLELSEGCAFDKGIARGSFIGNCKGYEQLVEFHSSKIKEYIHYKAGFEQLLLIHFEDKS